MADTDIIVSQMPNASQVGNSDLVMLTQPNAQAETGYSTAKTTVGAVAAKMLGDTEYVTDLPSFPEGKQNPFDALEELKASVEGLIDDNTTSSNKTWSAEKLVDELYGADSQYEDIPLTWTEGKYYKMNGDGSSGSSYKRSQLFPVTAGETLKITTVTGTNVCGIVYYNSNTASSSTFVGYDIYDSQETIKQYTDTDSLVPQGATYAAVNGRQTGGAVYGAKEPVPLGYSKITKINNELTAYESGNDFEIENLERRVTMAEKNNPFAWSAFDKSYFVFIHDDTNDYLETFADVFHTKGVPMGAATIPDRLTELHIATLNQVVEDGGEVLGHYSGSPTESSPDSLWLACTRDIKKALEEQGFLVRGLIKADATEGSTQKGEKYCRRYYDYANSHLGISEQFNLPRELMLNYGDLTEFKARIDTLANVNGIHGFGFHGGRSDEQWITAEAMAEIIDYINGKAGCEITTYSALFDEFGSTTLNERIKALEN